MLKTCQHDFFGLFLSSRARVFPGACFTGSVRAKCLLSCISNKQLFRMNPASEERSLLAGRSSSWKQQISEDNRSAEGFCGEETHRDSRTSPNFTEEELKIHRIHREACQAKQQMYIDPSSGYEVFTEYAHLRRGKCCGSGCRHCPYGQVNVKDPAARKHFNSLFYV